MNEDRIQGLEPLSSNAPIQSRPFGYPIPLTPAQRRLWIYAQEHRAGFSDRACFVAMRVTGPLNENLLQRVLDALVLRHEALRTRIAIDHGVATQYVDADCKARLGVGDLGSCNSAEAVERVTRLGAEFIAEQIDLRTGPLFAAKLFRISVREHVLILALDHIITDGTSNNIVVNELWTLYQQAARGAPFSLPATLQFPDYAVWQERTCDAWRTRHESYWRERLANAPHLRPPQKNNEGSLQPGCVGAVLEVPFGEPLTSKLRDLARRESTLLPLAVLTLYAAAASSLLHENDMIVGFAVNARSRKELRSVIGFLAGVLHLRITVAGTDCFHSLLQRISQEFRTAYEHQDFGRVPELLPECAAEVLFNWLPSPSVQVVNRPDQDRPGELEVQPISIELGWRPTFAPLSLFFADGAAGITMTARYASNLFATSTVAQLGQQLVQLATECSQNPLASLQRRFHSL